MDSETFLARCLTAMGGLSHLHSVRTIHVRSQRTIFPSRETVEINTYRKAGGRIRIEAQTTQQTVQVTIINGLAGIRHTYESAADIGTKKWPLVTERLSAPEVEAVKRSIRLYPRNFLAHADEHQYSDPFPTEEAGQPVYAIELPVEKVRLGFDGASFLCRSAEDRTSGTVLFYDDYQVIAEVTTPCRERCFVNGHQTYEETISSVEYNLELADSLFVVSG